MTISDRFGGLLATAARYAAVALVIGVGAVAGPAAAATCNVSSVQTDAGLNSLNCAVNLPGPGGNVRTQEMNAGAGVFNKTGWINFGKIDLPATAGGVLEITAAGDLKSGTWNLANGLVFDPAGHYALALKAGGPTGKVFNAVYELDISNNSGIWSTIDLLNRGGQQPALSNITLFGTAAPIPLPAAAWLMLAGLAGLGVVGRKRRAATA